LLVLFARPLLAGGGAAFAHPLWIEPACVYTLVRADLGGAENHDGDVYERARYVRARGEYAWGDFFSVSARFGATQYERTDAAPLREADRLGLGVKFVYTGLSTGGAFALGGSLGIFDRKRFSPERAGEDARLYLLRPALLFGWKRGALELLAEIRFQTETNNRFREEFNQEFRRHYQFGIALSWGEAGGPRLFAETEYREPYDRVVDAGNRFWHFYPGVAWDFPRFGRAAVSLLIPIRGDGPADRGMRISYFYLFD